MGFASEDALEVASDGEEGNGEPIEARSQKNKRLWILS